MPQLLPSLSSISSSSSPLFAVRTFLTLAQPRGAAVPNSLSRTLIFHSITTPPPPPSSSFSSITSLQSLNLGPVFSLVVVRCLSSAAAPASTLDWNEPVSCSEVTGDEKNSTIDKDSKPYIPVRAYFFSTSVDLRSLVEQNRLNFIPPTSRMTNYVLFKFGELANSDNSMR